MAVPTPPDRFLAPFVSRLPGAAELGGVLAQASGGLAFAREGSRDMVEVLQRSQAAWADLAGRMDLPSLPPGVGEASQELWGAVVNFANTNNPAALRSAIISAVGNAAYRSLVVSASSVPIVGWVVGMLVAGFQIGRTIWQQNNEYDGPTALGPAYDPDTDAAWVQGGLDRLRADPERSALFMPATIGDEILSARVQGDGVINRAWAIEGDSVGMGCIPGAGRVWQAWYFNTDTEAEKNETRKVKRAHGMLPPGSDYSWVRSWDDYHPSVRSAAALWWDACEAPGAAAWSVDTQRVEQAWRDWALVFERHAADGDRMTNRRAASVLYPTRALIDTGGACNLSQHPHKDAQACGVVGWVVRRMELHRERLRKFAGTTSVAYVSEDAPALRDAGVRAVFEQRRRQLLEHPAALRVSASAVPDADYRAAMVRAQATMRPLVARPGTPAAPDPAPAPKPVPLPRLPGTPPGGAPPPSLPPGPVVGGGGAGALLLGALFLLR